MSTFQDCVCPITHLLMRDPVIAADGHSYDAEAIDQWFASGKKTSPLTGSELPNLETIPNITLRKIIAAHVEDSQQKLPCRADFSSAEDMNKRLSTLLEQAGLSGNAAMERELLVSRLSLPAEYHGNAATVLAMDHADFVFASAFSESRKAVSLIVRNGLRELYARGVILDSTKRAYLRDKDISLSGAGMIAPQLEVLVEGQPLLQRVLQIPGYPEPRTYVIIPEELPVPYTLKVTHLSAQPAVLCLDVDNVHLKSMYVPNPQASFTYEHWTTRDVNGVHVVAPLLFTPAEVNEDATDSGNQKTDSSFFEIRIWTAEYDKDRTADLITNRSPPAWSNQATRKKEFRGKSCFGPLETVHNTGSQPDDADQQKSAPLKGMWVGKKYAGSVKIYYDSASALLLQGVSAEALGLQGCAITEIEERADRDRDMDRAKKRSLQLASDSYIHHADLTAEDGSETWTKKPRPLKETIEVT